MRCFFSPAFYSGTRADVLALLAGTLLPLAFAPFHFFPLAILAPALLFFVWLGATPRLAFRRGWLFGVGMFGVGISWIYVAIHDFGHTNMFLAVLLTGGFVAFLALFPAVLGYAATRLLYQKNTPIKTSRETLKLLLVFPAGWTLFEWIRSWILTGFPWLNLGNSQIDAPLAGLAPLLGVYGISLATALSAALLVCMVIAEKNIKLRALFAFAILWGLSALLGQIVWTQPLGKPLHVALIQGNIPQDIKWRPEQQQHTLELYTDLTRRQWGRDLILWPEGAVPVFYDELADTYLAALQNEARAHGTDMLIGLPVLDQKTDRYYNSMMSLGRSQGFYHKQHLVPFGDYVPLQEVLRGLIGFFDLPMSGFSAGTSDQALLEVAGHKTGISICYEDVFGEEVIRTLPEASLLVNATNNAWYGDSLAPPQHLQMSRMRA
ncbi:MAG: apolipoprotein N-acyltransferase, partial [Gammaproteobacteria bacterium]